MRVTKTLLGSELYVPDEGGSVRWFENVYTRYPFGKAGVLSRRISGRATSESLNGVRVYRRPLRWRSALKPFDFAEIAPAMCHYATQLCRADGYRAIHCGRVFPEGLAGWWAHRRLGIPYLVYVHGEEVSRYQMYRIERRLMPIILREASTVLANSNSSRNLALRSGARADRIEVVRPGVDAERFSRGDAESIRRRFGLRGAKLLVTVGRLTARKGHHQVIRALPKVIGRVGPTAYLIVGRGECEQELRDLAAHLGVSDHVIFAGLVPDGQLPSFYAAGDVFVMPNRRLPDGDVEGFGMVFIEAGAAGRPVIGGRSGGVPEAIDHQRTGLLVDAESVDAVADAISRLLSDEALRTRMGQAGRQRAQREFDWDGIAQRIQATGADTRARQAAPVPT